VRGLNNCSWQREQLRLCSFQAGSQLSLPCLEFGIAQGGSYLSYSTTLSPQTLQSCINRAELTLQRRDLVRFNVIDARLEIVAAQVNSGEEGCTRRPQLGASSFGLRRYRLQ
jgi:hypothetical protein